MGTRLLAGGVAGLVLVVATACGPGSAGPSGGSPGASRAPAATRGPAAAESCSDEPGDGTQIAVDTHAFPAETKIAAGESVTWTNEDDLNHTVTFRGGPRCGTMLIGGSYTVQFDTPGTYDYFCDFHSTVMRAKVVVE